MNERKERERKQCLELQRWTNRWRRTSGGGGNGKNKNELKVKAADKDHKVKGLKHEGGREGGR